MRPLSSIIYLTADRGFFLNVNSLNVENIYHILYILERSRLRYDFFRLMVHLFFCSTSLPLIFSFSDFWHNMYSNVIYICYIFLINKSYVCVRFVSDIYSYYTTIYSTNLQSLQRRSISYKKLLYITSHTMYMLVILYILEQDTEFV